jgi:hypothetical protein
MVPSLFSIEHPNPPGGSDDHQTQDPCRNAGGAGAASRLSALRSTGFPAGIQEVELMRKDIQSQKRQVIAANMKLTDKEAEQFWPIFDQYNTELIKINDKKYAAIKAFAQSYDTLTGDQAEKLTRDGLEVDQAVAQLRQKYIPIFSKVIPGRKTALFMQLDRRLVMMIDLQLSAAIPLVEP